MGDWKKVLEDLQERNLITTKEASDLQEFNKDLEKNALKIPIGKVVDVLADTRTHHALIGGILAMPAISSLISKVTGPLAYNRDFNAMKNSLEKRYPSTMQDVKRNNNEEKLHEGFEVLYKFSPTVAKTPTLASDAVQNFYTNKDIFTVDALQKLVSIESNVPKYVPTVGLLRSKVVGAITGAVKEQTTKAVSNLAAEAKGVGANVLASTQGSKKKENGK